jgi:archaemetzincin
MDLQNITLISFGYFEEDFLKKIAGAVNHEFFFSVNIKEGHIDLSEFYDPVRRQYNGNKLLKEVDSLYATDLNKTIGLFNVDLFIPILTYIFGQAFLNGRTGIASLYRFSNERYGMNSDDKFILDRFKKEVIHELGHAFGLIHCHVPTCVMRSGTYVEDIDQKSETLCFRCRNEVNSILLSGTT